MSSSLMSPRGRSADLSGLDQVARATLGDQVYAQLSEMLVAGQFAPADQLSLRNLATRLGVSMMPVREAVSRLTADGALEVTPNRAVRVPEMSAERFVDLTRTRVVVEGFAAAEAARRRDDETFPPIAGAEAAFRAEIKRPEPDPVAVIALNKDFHFSIYRAAASPTLMEIVRSLWLKAGPIINLDFRESRERLAGGGVLRRHGRALAAVRDRDPDAARQAIAEDIQSAADFILDKHYGSTV